jgi:hypothetical protein
LKTARLKDFEQIPSIFLTISMRSSYNNLLEIRVRLVKLMERIKKSGLGKLLSNLWSTLQRNGRRGRRKLAFLVFGVCILMFMDQQLCASASVSFEQLSWDERFFIRQFFLYFLKEGDLGHVLFFDTKPACFTSINKKPRRSYRSKNILKGWHYWKQVETEFHHSNFIFLEEEVLIGRKKFLHIFVINKKTLSEVLQANLDLFQQVLGYDFSPQNFITSLEKERQLRPLIHDDEALLGIILGFGAESSLEFKQQKALRENELARISHTFSDSSHTLHDDLAVQMDEAVLLEHCPHPSEQQSQSAERRSVQKKCEKSGLAPKWTDSYTRVAAHAPKKCRIFPVAFMGNPHSTEVQTLLDCYTEELEEIWNVCRLSKDPLKSILNQLCEE